MVCVSVNALLSLTHSLTLSFTLIAAASVSMFETLQHAYGKLGDFDKVAEMCDMSVPLTPRGYSYAIQILCKHGHPERALSLLVSTIQSYSFIAISHTGIHTGPHEITAGETDCPCVQYSHSWPLTSITND